MNSAHYKNINTKTHGTSLYVKTVVQLVGVIIADTVIVAIAVLVAE